MEQPLEKIRAPARLLDHPSNGLCLVTGGSRPGLLVSVRRLPGEGGLLLLPACTHRRLSEKSARRSSCPVHSFFIFALI